MLSMINFFVMKMPLNAIAHYHCRSTFCKSTAPKPKSLVASVWDKVSAFRSYKSRTGVLEDSVRQSLKGSLLLPSPLLIWLTKSTVELANAMQQPRR